MYEIFVYMFGHNEIVIPLLPVSASHFLASCCEDIFLYHAIIFARLRTCIDFCRIRRLEASTLLAWNWRRLSISWQLSGGGDGRGRG